MTKKRESLTLKAVECRYCIKFETVIKKSKLKTLKLQSFEKGEAASINCNEKNDDIKEMELLRFVAILCTL